MLKKTTVLIAQYGCDKDKGIYRKPGARSLSVRLSKVVNGCTVFLPSERQRDYTEQYPLRERRGEPINYKAGVTKPYRTTVEDKVKIDREIARYGKKWKKYAT